MACLISRAGFWLSGLTTGRSSAVPARRWTRQAIIQEIHDLHAAGESLKTRNMRRLGYGGMLAAAYRNPNLGSWRAAVEAAGLNYEGAAPHQRKWTRTRIVAAIKKLHQQGSDLSYTGMKQHHPYLLLAARRADNFGSWQAAIEAAGLDYEQVARR